MNQTNSAAANRSQTPKGPVSVSTGVPLPPIDSKACTGLTFPFPFPPEYDAPMRPDSKK